MIRNRRVSLVVLAALTAGGLYCIAGGQGREMALKGARPVIDAGKLDKSLVDNNLGLSK
jgi:hypothetical protein